MLNVTDRPHFSENISDGIKLILQLRFSGVPEITSKDLSHKQDEQPSGLTAFRPVTLSVSAHETFHHAEVLLLFVTKSVMMLCSHRVCIDLQCSIRKETCLALLSGNLLFVEREAFQKPGSFAVSLPLPLIPFSPA